VEIPQRKIIEETTYSLLYD